MGVPVCRWEQGQRECQGGANSHWSFNWGDPTFFYSRRIGRIHQGSLPSYDYVDMPLGTHIVGAGKLTGRLTDDWNIGMIHAVTSLPCRPGVPLDGEDGPLQQREYQRRGIREF